MNHVEEHIVEQSSLIGDKRVDHVSNILKYPDCWKCSSRIQPPQLAFRIPDPNKDNNRIYYFHLNCFNCFVCNCPLRKGQLFGLKSGSIYCDQHYEWFPTASEVYQQNDLNSMDQPKQMKIEQELQQTQSSINNMESINQNQALKIPRNNLTVVDGMNINNSNSHSQQQMDESQNDSDEKNGEKKFKPKRNIKKRPLKRSNSDEGSHHHQHHDSVYGVEPSMNHQSDNNFISLENCKRIRTSFQEFQLDLLRNCFKRTHKPNSWEFNRLVEKTGLSKRVLQIWFQNQRSKWSRYVLSKPLLGPLMVEDSGKVDDLFRIDLILKR